ncbi:hypothetical protein [Hydrogenophaga pseudoflava]|uniref:hypothetical protein n=1 Tax=Hydrogenophaga pseudoflava TaxID=47421 RepID=UPI0027E3BC60|nr:hypothetical protein [Hydrogenophaga pseudoflava]MDQ7745385.1 hypothetical protein [Hydrogenophaga pseudoflava]
MRSPCRLVPALIVALPLALTGPAFAGVFKCKGPEGTTIFQDSECGPASQSLQTPKGGSGPAVDLTQPMDKRFKTPEEKERLQAALKISGLDQGMRRGIEFCRTHAAAHVAGIEQVYNGWRQQHAVAISTSESLIEKYTTARERADSVGDIVGLLEQSLQLRAGNETARNTDNCKSAPVKLQSFLTNRHTDIYSTVGGSR